MSRKEISSESVEHVILELIDRLEKRVGEKGTHGFASTHEIFGVLHEEHSELLDAVIQNDKLQARNELFDIMIGALWGICSIEMETIDW